jgi:PAS domain S-box-containing protein
VEISSNYFYFDDKEYMVSLCRDITMRKRAEEALQESEKKYRSLVERVNDWVWEVDTNGLYSYASPRVRELLGYEPDEMIGTSPIDYMAPEESERVEALLSPIFRAREEFSLFESTLIKKDGSKVILETSGVPIFDARGTFIGYRGIDRDITERRRAENDIIRSEKMLQLIMDNVPQAIFWKDRNSIYLGCNKVFARAAGIGMPGDIRGKTDYDLPWSREQSDHFREHDSKVMENDTPEYHIVEQQREASGRIAWLETNKVPLHDTKGNVTGVLGTYEDITVRKRAEEAVMLAGAYNRSLIEASVDPLVTISQDGVITDVNKATESVTGYPREKLISTDFSYYFTEPEKAKEGYLTAFKQGSVTDYALEIRHKDGHITPVIYNASVFRDESGKVIGVFAAARDITERKRAEVALKESEEKYRLIVETTNQGICTLDASMTITFVNKRLAGMMGYLPEEMIGRSVWDFQDEAGKATAIEKMEGQRRGISESFEIKAIRKNGTPIWVIISAVPNYDKDGRFVGSFAMLTDITERKQAENALQDAKDQVELYVDLMGHDINNMNQVSMGFLELAHNIVEMDGKLGEDNIVLLDKAMGSLKSSSQLIDNVRKLQREKLGLYEPEVLDVGIVIEDAVKHFHGNPGRDIKITSIAPDHCLVRANALLKDVFINLVGNAIKHSKGALMVNIGVSQVIDNGKTYCRVDVEDNGPGIPDTLKNTLFDRLSLTTTRAKGKGFGLCLIKLLVDDYQGKFWVENLVPGDHTKGTRFVVMLPAVGQ